jgi:phage repressor protein C with HTH and peptisase S24 domain
MTGSELPLLLETGTPPLRCRTVEIFGNSMLPLYRHGDRLMVSDAVPAVAGDRVAVILHSGEAIAGTLVHRTKQAAFVGRGGLQSHCVELRNADIEYFGRILWASQ